MPATWDTPRPVSVSNGGELHTAAFVVHLRTMTVTYGGKTASAEIDDKTTWPEQQAAQLLRKLIADAPYKK